MALRDDSSDGQSTVFIRIAQRVEDILQAARDREKRGQHLALEIDARFRLQDIGAVQYQLACAILEEVGGIGPEEVPSELLSLGLAAVLDGAAKAAQNMQEGSQNSGEVNIEAIRNIVDSGPRTIN